MSLPGGSNKENISINRGLIKIKPRKYMGNCHLLWCKEGEDRSSLIRLERESLTGCDME